MIGVGSACYNGDSGARKVGGMWRSMVDGGEGGQLW